MGSWTKRRDEILEQEVSNKGKRVFLVEGEDDVSCYQAALSAHLREDAWDTRWTITHAGSKDFVLKMLKEHPDWIGLIDRDEWPEEQIQSLTSNRPNLHVLPRYCMESYLIVPDEIWAAFSTQYQQRFAGGEVMFHQMILRDLPKWVRHGVLWSIINPLQNELISSGFKDHLLSFDNAQDDAKIQQKLQEWSRLLDSHTLYQEFQDRLACVQELPITTQLTHWVHGKKFWSSRVVPVLTHFLGRRSPTLKPYHIELWEQRQLPSELLPIFQIILQP